MVQSPGYAHGSYPDKVECTWTIQRPTAETRAMSLRFNSFVIQSMGDYLQVLELSLLPFINEVNIALEIISTPV